MKRDETKWFSHEAHTHTLPEILAMMDKHTTLSYAWYWILMEVLRAEKDFKYDISRSFAYRSLARLMGSDEATIKQWITDCIDEFGLFEKDEQFLWSPALCARLEMMEEKKESLRERGRKGAEVTNAKKAAQAKNNDGTSESLPQPNSAHNRTEQNITEHNNYNNTTQNTTEHNNNNNTTQNDSSVNNNSSSSIEVEYWDNVKRRALADKKFIHHYISSGITEQQLASWMDAFNRKLEFEGAPSKPEHEYRKHFANWFKFRDLAKEKPEDHIPMPLNKVTPTIPEKPISFMKTAKQILEEQARAREECEQRLIREEQERERLDREKALNGMAA